MRNRPIFLAKKYYVLCTRTIRLVVLSNFLLLLSNGSLSMQIVNEAEQNEVITKVPVVKILTYDELLEEEEEERQYSYSIASVVEDDFPDDGEELEVLNIHIDLAKHLKEIPNTVNMKYFDKIEEWNDRLMKFYLSVFETGETLSYSFHQEAEALYIFTFNDKAEFEKEIRLNLENRYTDSKQSDWDKKVWESAFDSAPKEYTQLMLGLELPIKLISLDLGCVFMHSKDKSIRIFCSNEVPNTVRKLVSESGLYLIED